MKYIDAHAHLNFNTFDNDREEVISSMHKEQVGAINVGIDAATSEASIDLASKHDHIWASVGCHPTEVKDDFEIHPYRKLIEKGQSHVVAVGECGLDYFRSANRSQENMRLQRRAFMDQIELALEYDLPLILHIRPQEGSMDAYKEALEILDDYSKEYGDKLRGTAHFFVGDYAIARRFLDLGFHLSATGVVTFDDTLQKVFGQLPTDKILVETDAPFVAPEPHRGKRNSPLYIPDIIAALAAVKDMNEADLAQKLVANTQGLFSL